MYAISIVITVLGPLGPGVIGTDDKTGPLPDYERYTSKVLCSSDYNTKHADLKLTIRCYTYSCARGR